VVCRISSERNCFESGAEQMSRPERLMSLDKVLVSCGVAARFWTILRKQPQHDCDGLPGRNLCALVFRINEQRISQSALPIRFILEKEVHGPADAKWDRTLRCVRSRSARHGQPCGAANNVAAWRACRESSYWALPM
jgi:hypothetical protein